MPNPLGNARQSADVLGKTELTAGEIRIEFIHDLQPVDAHFHSIRQTVIGSDGIDEAGAAAFAAAGITPADIDVARSWLESMCLRVSDQPVRHYLAPCEPGLWLPVVADTPP
jgi:hypothetical protein